MDGLGSKSQLDMARNVHDLGSINKMREAIASGDEDVLQEAAQQFEAIFVQMMLKSMRKAQDALADENSPFNSEQVKFYRDMHDQQLAADLTSNGGMGLADIIVKQMGHSEDSYQPASTIRSDGNLSSLNRSRVEQTEQAQESVLVSESKGTRAAIKDSMFESPEDFQYFTTLCSRGSRKIWLRCQSHYCTGGGGNRLGTVCNTQFRWHEFT